MKPIVSIVIPVFNNVRSTIECLESIKAHADIPIEIIVSGTGTDGTIGAMHEWVSRYNNLKFVESGLGKTHFSANVNRGAKEAVGDFICILNNDVLVTPHWLSRMLHCYERIAQNFESFPAPPPGVIAPCSNYVLSHQMEKLESGAPITPQNYITAAEEIANRHRGKWFYSSVVSGFCMLIVRKVFEMVGGLDEELINGNEDIEFCNRVNLAGFSCIVDRSTFLFHYGSQTLKESTEINYEGGTYNRIAGVLKICGETPTIKKISGNIRLKCSQEELDRWVRHHYDLFDVINIVDDDSGWDMGKFLKAFPKCTYQNMAGNIEVVQRTRLYELSLEQKVDWMVVLDHDEFLEEKINRAYLQRLVNLPTPSVYAYSARWIHLWNSPSTYHVNYPPTTGVFMARCLPNLKFFAGSPGHSLHCSRLPNMPAVSIAPTNVHILHYGYLDAQKRESKRAYYEAIDPTPVEALVGGSDYSHLTNQNHIVISEWLGSHAYSLSLCSMTEHEPIHRVQIMLETVGPMLDEIVFRVPPGSPAIPILERWGAKIIQRVWNDDYSDMRNSVLAEAKSNYLLVLDIDEQLSEPMEISRLLESQPTAIMFSVNNYQKNRPNVSSEVMRMFQNRPEIRFSGILHETIEESIQKLKKKVVIRAQSVINHYGFLTPRLPKKLQQYVKLNLAAIEKDPLDCKPYFNLALHYLEDGDILKALDNFNLAIGLNPQFTLAKVELGKVYLRFAQSLLASSLSEIPPGHPLHRPVSELEKILARLNPGKEMLFPPIGRPNVRPNDGHVEGDREGSGAADAQDGAGAIQ